MNSSPDWLDQVNDWHAGVSAPAQAPGEGNPAPQQDEEQPKRVRDAVHRRLHRWAEAIEQRAGVAPPGLATDPDEGAKDANEDSAPAADRSTKDTPQAAAVPPGLPHGPGNAGRIPAPGRLVDLDELTAGGPFGSPEVPQEADAKPDADSEGPDGKGAKNDGSRFASNRSRRFFKAAQRAKAKISKDEELSQEEKGKQIAEAIEADPLARDGLGEQLVDDVVDFIPEGMTKKAAIQYGDYVIENADQWKIGRATRKASAFWEAVSDLVKWAAYNGSAALAGHSVPWWTGGQYPSLTDLTRRLLFSLGENSEQWWVVPLVGVSATLAVWLAIDIKPREWCKTKSEIAQNSGNRLRKLLDIWFIPGWIFRIPLASVAAATAITAVPAVIQISTGAPT